MTEIDSPFKMLVLVILFFFRTLRSAKWRRSTGRPPPELDDELNLDDQTPWGERVRIDLNEKEVRIRVHSSCRFRTTTNHHPFSFGLYWRVYSRAPSSAQPNYLC